MSAIKGLKYSSILYGTRVALSAKLVVNAIADDAPRPTFRSGTTRPSPGLAQWQQPVEPLSTEPGTGRALELAHAPGPAQRHGGAHPVAENARAGLDRPAPAAPEISDPFGSATHVRWACPGGKSGGGRLERARASAAARSQPGRAAASPASVGSLAASLPLPGLSQPGGTEPAVQYWVCDQQDRPVACVV